MKLYHIDRTGLLREGQLITLQIFNDVRSENFKNDELQGELDKWFPSGVSRHGDSYFVSSRLFQDTSPEIELLMELYRRTFYPTNISRFQAFFAVDFNGLNKMKEILTQTENYKYEIYEVECDEFERHDMSLLLNIGSNLFKSGVCNLYWSGACISDLNGVNGISPVYEYLVKLPIKIGKRIV